MKKILKKIIKKNNKFIKKYNKLFLKFNYKLNIINFDDINYSEYIDIYDEYIKIKYNIDNLNNKIKKII